jgi:hypothetical protein
MAVDTSRIASALRELICSETREVCQRTYNQALRAIVLTGSLARNEATFVERSDGEALLGDAEFLLIFHSGAPLPSADAIHHMQIEIEGRLLRKGLRGTVTLSSMSPDFLRRLSPSIFAYELFQCGSLIAGDQLLLNLVRRFGPSEIPLEDAWRLLANRIVEQLETVRLRTTDGASGRDDVQYRTVKLCLDTATSLLVFIGGYKPTYAERAVSLCRLAELPTATEWPFAPEAFAENIAACTRWKLASRQPEGPPPVLFEEAVNYARALWTWELSRLTNVTEQSTPETLVRCWMRRQPLAQRVRGWAYVLRRRGWYRSWRYWPHWAYLALRGSPRYLVYAAASELLFSAGGLSEASAQLMRRCLPVAEAVRTAETTPGVSNLPAEVLANYYEFLVDTSS